MRWSWFALASVFAIGCSEENSAPRALPFDTMPQCSEGDVACVNAEVSSFEVDGVRVIHRRVEGHPLVAMQLNFDGAPEARGDQFWAESLALGVFESTGPRRLPYPEWTNRLADLSASVSVSTGVDYHTISALAPRPRWRALWHLVMDALEQPYLEPYFLDHERAVREYTFTSEQDEPDSAASAAAFSRLFRGQAYNVAREHRAALARVSTGELTEAWRSLLTKQRLLLVMVGDVTEQDARYAVRDALVSFPAQHQPHFVDYGDPSELGPAGKVVVLDYPASPTWYLRSYFEGPTPHAAEYAALRLGVRVLGQRLFDRVRDAQGLAYTTGASTAFGKQTYASVWLSTNAPNEALPLFREVIAELKSNGPDLEELDAVRSTVQTELFASIATPAGMAAFLASWELAAGDRRGIDDHFANLAAASPQDVAAALRTYLRDGATAAAGPGGELTEADLSALYE